MRPFDSNKIFNVALRRKSLPTLVLDDESCPNSLDAIMPLVADGQQLLLVLDICVFEAFRRQLSTGTCP